MVLPKHKTKIVCTIGPATDSLEMMVGLLQAGMNIARLNFSHGTAATHAKVIGRLREASRQTEIPLAIMADLPGPKIRLGQIDPEPIQLTPGNLFTLTVEDCIGNSRRASVSFDPLPRIVKVKDVLFLNDGIIQLEVCAVKDSEVACRVIVGGELRSRKGLNLPGIDLGISAFTPRDLEWLRFAADRKIDAISQSFVDSSQDIDAVRTAAREWDYHPFIIAKIERSRAVERLDEIMAASNGIMVARGDLGVEMPIEQIPLLQKEIIRKANLLDKPVITATQMMESMTQNSRPTRAEATDVANAILDGTDAVMLSGESAMGKFPVETVMMLARIAEAAEPQRPDNFVRETLRGVVASSKDEIGDLLALSVEMAIRRLAPAAVVVPTWSGKTARHLNWLKLPAWVLAICQRSAICHALQFSYGIFPLLEPKPPEDWKDYSRDLLKQLALPGHRVILIQGPSPAHPDINFKMEVIEF